MVTPNKEIVDIDELIEQWIKKTKEEKKLDVDLNAEKEAMLIMEIAENQEAKSEFNTALENWRTALKILQQHKQEDKPYILNVYTCMLGLMRCYAPTALNDPKEMLCCFNQALELIGSKKSLLSGNAPEIEIAKTYLHLANCYGNNSDERKDNLNIVRGKLEELQKKQLSEYEQYELAELSAKLPPKETAVVSLSARQ